MNIRCILFSFRSLPAAQPLVPLLSAAFRLGTAGGLACVCGNLPLSAADVHTVPVNSVTELAFDGPKLVAADEPVLSVEFSLLFRHESGSPAIRVQGFWDGPAMNDNAGSIWKVRFTPTQAGRWLIEEVSSNRRELNDQREGDVITAVPSPHHGFWRLDRSGNGRWFRRSDGSHHYIIGNTHYDFLSRPNGHEATAATIRADVAGNARYFKKLRFGVFGFRRENRSTILKPFLDAAGRETDVQTDLPNPRFFRERVDVAVQAAFDADLITDLILGGTTGDQYARRPGFIKYMAARYGAYPNVWFTIGQEFNEQTDAATQQRIGQSLAGQLPYGNPISTHATAGWDPALTGDWQTHSIRQLKASILANAADAMQLDHRHNGGKPTVNDENGYDPGEASTADVVEGILGTFAGGGYGSTGHKSGSKEGGYFWGHAALGRTLDEHPSAPHLQFLRAKIDEHLAFWRLVPRDPGTGTLFAAAPPSFRVLEENGWQYVLCSNAESDPFTIELPNGEWKIVQLDLLAQRESVLATHATGGTTLATPDSRAAMTLVLRVDRPRPDSTAAHPAEAEPATAQTVPTPLPEPVARGSSAPRILTVSNELSPAVIGRRYSDDLEAERGHAPLSWSLVRGTLPPGLAIVGSEITGKPQAAGTFRFTVQVTDREGNSDQSTLEFVVRPSDQR